MRLLMIFGGLIGFLIGILTGLAQEGSWPTIFWRASVAALLAGLVLRWWGKVWMKSLLETQRQRSTAPARPASSAAAAQAEV